MPAARDQTINLVGGAYDFGVVRVFGQYTAVTNDRLRSKDKLPHFGLTVPFALGQLQFSSGQDTNTATTNTGSLVTKRKTTSLGYVHYLSKRTDLYAFIMADKLPVGTASSHVAGIRHQF